MSEFEDNVEAAASKAAEGIANAETLEEAIEWNRILSNLLYIQQQVIQAEEPLEEDVPAEAVHEPFIVEESNEQPTDEVRSSS